MMKLTDHKIQYSSRLQFGVVALLSVLSCWAGYSVNYHHPKKTKSIVAENIATNNSALDMVNPLSECMRSRGMHMEELKTFKPLIVASIEKYLNKNPSLHVSYYFRDMNNGMWIGLAEKERFSPASLMKVPCMIAVLREADKDPSILQKKLKYSSNGFDGNEEEAGYPKKEGELYAVDDLLRQSIGYSDNAATSMLLNFIGIEKMTKVEDELNLHIEKDYTPYTDFVSVKNYADVLRIIYNGAFLSEAMSEKALELLLTSQFDRGIKAGIPEGIKIAHKYGDRDLVNQKGQRATEQLHEFALVYHPGKTYLIGIMTKGPGTREEKEAIVKELSAITWQEVDRQTTAVTEPKNKAFLRSL